MLNELFPGKWQAHLWHHTVRGPCMSVLIYTRAIMCETQIFFWLNQLFNKILWQLVDCRIYLVRDSPWFNMKYEKICLNQNNKYTKCCQVLTQCNHVAFGVDIANHVPRPTEAGWHFSDQRLQTAVWMRRKGLHLLGWCEDVRTEEEQTGFEGCVAGSLKACPVFTLSPEGHQRMRQVFLSLPGLGW